MVTRDSIVPVNPKVPKPHSDTHDHAHQWQQSPPHLEGDDEDDHHHQYGDATEEQHAALKVVVDVGQEGRRTGDDHGGVLELTASERRLHRVASLGQVVERSVTHQHRSKDRVALIGDEGAQGLAHR